MLKQYSAHEAIDHSKSLKNWAQVVEEYSRRSLTLGMDKLVAISGLAKYMATVLKDEYLAGIWRSALPGTLL